MKQVEAGRIAGPFNEQPFENMRISPFGLVVKKDNSYRMIHHLSYPSGSSLNDFIDPSICSVQYCFLDNAIAMISSLGKGALLGKMDIKSAFKLLPVNPKDFELLGFKLNNEYFVQKT